MKARPLGEMRCQRVIKGLSKSCQSGGELEGCWRWGAGWFLDSGKRVQFWTEQWQRFFPMDAVQFVPLLRAREGGMGWTRVGQECWRMAWGFFRRLAKY
jgi:hypothetical protein